ncbi:major facilitator superfamily domain-containing protein 4A [Hydra vulgaris]|uniref:major facilitator superfamily domain-containing protein 4A n=1 Tax=Hydra vulgaris TaxID=6087 RepID=UPI001F5EA0D8|nr:major facilitator superfamily domain-containing protein 4A [Hydra vulgaris]
MEKEIKNQSPTAYEPCASSTPRVPKKGILNDKRRNSGLSENAIESDDSKNDTSITKKTFCTPKIEASFVLCCGFLCFGSSMAIIGPTVLELGCLTGEDVGQMSWVFFAQTSSALMGAIFSGVITDRFAINYNVFLAAVMSFHAVALAILPMMRVLGTLLLLTALHGLFGGFQDTATNLRMIIMHGQEVPPYLQTLFFFYGLGAFLSPIIAGRFLSEECNNGFTDDLMEFAFVRRRRHNMIGVNHWIKHSKSSEIMLSLNATSQPASVLPKITSTRVHYAYFIIAAIHITVTSGLWYLFYVDRKREQEERRRSLSDSEEDSVASLSDDSLSRSERSEIDPNIKSQVLCISFWIASMVFISDGLQGSFGSYIYTYAIKSNIGISHDDAAYLNSLFWGALAAGRLLAIFVSMYVSPRIMLLVDIIGCLSSILLMFLFRFQAISLWIGTATFGLCLSNIFPTSVSMAESYFRLTGTITCFFVVCSGMGEMTIPLLIGKLFDIIGPTSFLVISCILCFASFGIYAAVIITGQGISRAIEESRRSSLTISSKNSPVNKPKLPQEQAETHHFNSEDLTSSEKKPI